MYVYMCVCTYIEETSRTLEKRLSELKNVVRNTAPTRVAAHIWTKQRQVDWKAAKTREMEGTTYWKRRVLEALCIHQQQHISKWTVIWPLIHLSYIPLFYKPTCS